MSQKQFLVQLSAHERDRLQEIIRSGKHKARKITRCRILLMANGPNGKTDQEIADALNVALATIFNIRRRYAQEGLEPAISGAAPFRSASEIQRAGRCEDHSDRLQHSASRSSQVELAFIG